MQTTQYMYVEKHFNIRIDYIYIYGCCILTIRLPLLPSLYCVWRLNYKISYIKGRRLLYPCQHYYNIIHSSQVL